MIYRSCLRDIDHWVIFRKMTGIIFHIITRPGPSIITLIHRKPLKPCNRENRFQPIGQADFYDIVSLHDGCSLKRNACRTILYTGLIQIIPADTFYDLAPCIALTQYRQGNFPRQRIALCLSIRISRKGHLISRLMKRSAEPALYTDHVHRRHDLNHKKQKQRQCKCGLHRDRRTKLPRDKRGHPFYRYTLVKNL